jgi:DNA-binding NtrC family response regulator
MRKTVYVVVADATERTWINSALAKCVDRVVFLEDTGALPTHLAPNEADCLLISAEPTEHGAVNAIRELRAKGNTIAAIALGSDAVFRSAVDIARMQWTDFLEQPVSDRELQQAVLRMCTIRR